MTKKKKKMKIEIMLTIEMKIIQTQIDRKEKNI